MNRSLIAACVLMFGALFVLLALSWGALPLELPVLRNPLSGHVLRMASKSLFAVFRVPAMNLFHGLMAMVMLAHAADFKNRERRIFYANLFSTLLFAIAFKSNFEAMELSSLAGPTLLGSYQGWLRFCSGASVIVGVGLALLRGRRAPVPWPELRFPVRDKMILAGLFALYLGVVVASSLASHPA